jgi:hypothetical protein
MNPTKFDELTKQLAKSTSRRRALRTILTTSIGGVVGLGAIRSVFGNKVKCGGGPPNSDCAHWCAAVFGEDTPAAGQCTSDAAHNTGDCCRCGVVDPSAICCVRDSSGFCVPGTIVAGCFCSNPAETCQNGQCVCSPGTCGNFQDHRCGDLPPLGCFCGSTAEGGSACWHDDFCINVPGCTSTADCPPNSVCMVNTCCGVPVCFPLCNADAPVQRAQTGSGPTGAHL